MNIRSHRRGRPLQSPRPLRPIDKTAAAPKAVSEKLPAPPCWAKNLVSRETAAGLFSGMKLLLLALALLSPLVLPLKDSYANEYLRSRRFEKVFVTKGDDLAAIAARYAADDDSRNKLAAAIAKVNDLDPARPLPDGWRIAVPVIK